MQEAYCKSERNIRLRSFIDMTMACIYARIRAFRVACPQRGTDTGHGSTVHCFCSLSEHIIVRTKKKGRKKRCAKTYLHTL